MKAEGRETPLGKEALLKERHDLFGPGVENIIGVLDHGAEGLAVLVAP